MTGETLNRHVRRGRLERAALLMKTSPRNRITDVAIEAGFAGTAEFSRAFRNHFDRAPSSWDRRSPLEKSKICKAPEMLSLYPSKEHAQNGPRPRQEHSGVPQRLGAAGRGLCALEELESWKAAANVRVRVSRFSAFRYVYIRIFEPYGNTRLVDAYHALTAWLADRQTDIRDRRSTPRAKRAFPDTSPRSATSRSITRFFTWRWMTSRPVWTRRLHWAERHWFRLSRSRPEPSRGFRISMAIRLAC
ncbi:MAG: helix-turn-helix domain-containing protein [Acidobacteria bacterium]|nr:helix-turn-helix domain-containing protein [Acidobacteriota bacterium]